MFEAPVKFYFPCICDCFYQLVVRTSRFLTDQNSASSNLAAASVCIPGRTWPYGSSVITTLLWPHCSSANSRLTALWAGRTWHEQPGGSLS